MEYMFEKAISFGDVYISDNNKATLLVNYSDRNRLTWNMIRLSVKLAFGCIGILNVIPVLKRQAIAKKHYPKEPHIQPMIIGVMDDIKGKGLGPRFMFEIKDHYKNNKLPVIIDTVSESNIKLYKRFGFKIIDKVETFSFPIYFLRLG